MADDYLQYDRLVEDALRGAVRKCIQQAADWGFVKGHHFYVTFDTNHADVIMDDRLRAKYPKDMTIILQHQYWGLEVGEESFSVTLSFNKQNERLTVPFAALTAFVDPSVKFGLQFTAAPGATPGRVAAEEKNPPAPGVASSAAEVVDISSFRKK